MKLWGGLVCSLGWLPCAALCAHNQPINQTQLHPHSHSPPQTKLKQFFGFSSHSQELLSCVVCEERESVLGSIPFKESGSSSLWASCRGARSAHNQPKVNSPALFSFHFTPWRHALQQIKFNLFSHSQREKRNEFVVVDWAALYMKLLALCAINIQFVSIDSQSKSIPPNFIYDY